MLKILIPGFSHSYRSTPLIVIFYHLDKEDEKEDEKVEAESASLESTYENEIGFGDPAPTEDTEEIGDTAAICSDLFQQLIEANFPLGQSEHEIHNFTGIDIAPIDSPSLDDIFIHPIGKHFISRTKNVFKLFLTRPSSAEPRSSTR